MGLGIVVEFLRARRPSLWYLFSYVFPFFVLGRISSFFFLTLGRGRGRGGGNLLTTHTTMFSSSTVLPHAELLYPLWCLAVWKSWSSAWPSSFEGSSGFTEDLSWK